MDEPAVAPSTADLDRVLDALRYAADHHVHRDGGLQMRKKTDIPYLSHLMIVAGYVWESGGDTDQVIAAVLHDTLEDTDVTFEDLQRRFNADIAQLVLGCSDGLDGGPRDKTNWAVRKRAYVASLPHKDDRALLITAADKAHNGSAIVADLQTYGSEVWSRFNGRPDQILEYYAGVLSAVEERLAGKPVIARLRVVVDHLTTLVKEAT